MNEKTIKYTVTWTERPENWNIPGAIKLLEAVRNKVLEQEKKNIEKLSIKETKLLIERLTCKK